MVRRDLAPAAHRGRTRTPAGEHFPGVSHEIGVVEEPIDLIEEVVLDQLRLMGERGVEERGLVSDRGNQGLLEILE